MTAGSARLRALTSVFGGAVLAPLLLAEGCGEPAGARAPVAAAGAPSSSSSSSLDRDAACARACRAMDRCGPGAACEARCVRDVAAMRDGFAASFAACLEHELATRGCGGGGRAFAEQRAAACWLAGVDLYAERAPEDALEPIVRAACARAVTCAGGPDEGCADALRGQLASRRGARALRALHPAVIDEASSCLRRAPCDDDGALDGCAERARALRADAGRGNQPGAAGSTQPGARTPDGGPR